MTYIVQYNNSSERICNQSESAEIYISGGYNIYLVSLGLYKVRMRSFEL